MKIAKEKKEKNKKAGNKQGIQFQIQSKIGASIIVVMAVIAVLVVVVVYNLLIKANNTELPVSYTHLTLPTTSRV